MDKIGIILLNYNAYEDTKECIESLKAMTYPNYEIFVVDNDSQDDSADRLKQIKDIHFIESGRNGGFGYGNNISTHTGRARASISSTSISTWRAGPAFQSAYPRAARATNISPSFQAATYIPATSSRATKIFTWATFTKAGSTKISVRALPRPASSRAKNATAVLPSSYAAAVAAPTTTISRAI